MLYGHVGEWRLLRCNKCKHQCIFPTLTDDTLNSIYSVDTYYSFKTRKINKFIRFIRSKTRRLLPHNLFGKRLLDYGCGDGEVLCFADEAGADVFGIEFGSTVEFLKQETEYNIQAQPASDWEGTMDYVRSFHSFEHIVDPAAVFELFRSLVIPETGRILIGVPNVDSWIATFFGKYYFYRGAPLHLHGYSPESIRLLGEAAGLEMVSISTPGGFRGVLGSISLLFQSTVLGSSREPSTIALMLMLPLYLFCLPLVFVGNLLHKGDVMEVVFKNPNV
jgi:SAM-dependent methyltransferase